jgi:hypothetical protein
MSHLPNKYDIVTDLRRSVMASYSTKAFEDENVKSFLANAEKNLESVRKDLGEKNYLQIKQRLEKAKNPNNVLGKRREDLLTASCIL